MIDTIKNYFGNLSVFSSDFQEFKLRVSEMLPSFNLPDDSTSNFLINGLANMQDTMASLSTSESSLVSAPMLLLAAGVVIFFGVIGESFFKKTGIPDVAFIMILGVLIGPVLGIIQPAVVLEVVPYFAALALIIIMFDGGLNLEIKSMVKTAHFASILSIIGFVISVGIVTGLTHYWLEWSWIESILLGSIVGGSSSAIVFGLVRNLHISGEAKSMLSFESALTDILATIVAFVLFEAVLTGSLDINTLGDTIGRAVAVGLLLGFSVGIPWMYLTTKLSNSQHAYMLTLGILFVLYFMANAFGESGALTALVFGLMLGNKGHLSRYLRFKLPRVDSDDSMHNQLTFLVRTFFFVFVGLLASFGNVEYIIFGIVATVIIYVGRVILTKTTLTKRFSKLDRKVTSVMIPRGLAAAVLATFPLTMGLPNAEAYPQIVFVIIMVSVIITTLGMGKAKKILPPESQEGGFVNEIIDNASVQDKS
ncbi:MAG: cation:proton antiporter [Nitrosopumilus sp.]|nr:cation:proton antiporter [Nitrosopumilus sp.]MDH3488561.1 cation:proton antiporter [Nitrosopumilus sp.]